MIPFKMDIEWKYPEKHTSQDAVANDDMDQTCNPPPQLFGEYLLLGELQQIVRSGLNIR